MTVEEFANCRPGYQCWSHEAGPKNASRLQLIVLPKGDENDGEFLRARVVLCPPHKPHGDVMLEVTVVNEVPAACLTLSSRLVLAPQKQRLARLFPVKLLKVTDIQPGSGWLDEHGHMHLRARAVFPPVIDRPRPAFREEPDFTQELTRVSFRLSDGQHMFFDKRLLITRSEYFRNMLAEDRYKEGAANLIDLSGNPQATQQSLTALLRFLVGGGFSSYGNKHLAFSVRRLADQYQLEELVQAVDRDLGSLLSEDNVFDFLAQTLGSGGSLESSCLGMLEGNVRLLEAHRPFMKRIMDEHPALAEKILDLLLDSAKRGQKRPRGAV